MNQFLVLSLSIVIGVITFFLILKKGSDNCTP